MSKGRERRKVVARRFEDERVGELAFRLGVSGDECVRLLALCAVGTVELDLLERRLRRYLESRGVNSGRIV
jgi:hypothetical protein